MRSSPRHPRLLVALWCILLFCAYVALVLDTL